MAPCGVVNLARAHYSPTTRIGLLSLVLIMASGCGSGSDGDSSTGSGVMMLEVDPTLTTGDMRLKTRTNDLLNDGIDDQREVFEYDEAGKAVSRTCSLKERATAMSTS